MSSERCFLALLFLLSTGFASSTFISDAIFESHGSTGRNLLQIKKECPVDFEAQNYTIITSQCKGPNYPAEICCRALKEFACPFADEINDVTNVCASTMFSYIHLYGKYPPGLFANLCKEEKEGIQCDALPPDSRKADASEGHMAETFSSILLMLEIGFFFFFHGF
ncbi:hypothetical protein MRB53_028824 [Persea americana]|uniref:Uncharacterized protein n=1 Tax=Persea americana TaxID=3435 RepID=A0ACC2KGM8_PERAE|nr:hypothetical protein MRB53_028824 [Persea americana]